jgi:hypothetical protein
MKGNGKYWFPGEVMQLLSTLTTVLDPIMLVCVLG